MRLKSLAVRNCPPVQRFEIDDLSDVIVVAGPNGAGKTRLLQHVMQHMRGASPNSDLTGIIEATSDEERETWGGKHELDMSLAADMTLLQQTFQVNRLRRKLRSSLVNFESDRTIQTIQPFNFTWQLPDPDEETVSWKTSFNRMTDRYQDTVHSLFKMIEFQRKTISTRAMRLQREGKTSMPLNFVDPMNPFKDVFSLLLAPKQLITPSGEQQKLQYTLDDQTFEFSALSSGEREVVNIAFDFLLRKPQDCIVFFDEPELHLHPEFSYRLIQTLEQIGERNQFILATHSPDIISGSLDRTVVFITSPSQTSSDEPENQAVLVTETDDTHRALKLLGHSIGIIALGKRIILIEGEQSSIDKQTYGAIVKSRWPGIVLVPSGGKHVIQSFSLIYEAVLSRTLWGVDFFMLCDRDSAPTPDEITAGKESGRLRILSRYHLENYFLDEHVWAEAFAPMELTDSWLRSPVQIRAKFKDISRGLVSYATALFVSSQLRRSFGNIDLMPSACHGKTLTDLKLLLLEEVSKERVRAESALDDASVNAMADEYFGNLTASLDNDTEDWKNLIPGKALLGIFAGHAATPLSRAKTLYLNAGLQSKHQPFAEILDIFEHFGS